MILYTNAEYQLILDNLKMAVAGEQQLQLALLKL
jgi:hypothetical protein